MTTQTMQARPLWHTLLIKLDDWAIRRHLRRTERYLRKSDISHLSPDLKIARERNLEHLRDYWRVGQFPRNTVNSQKRVPCFIDEQGTHCAVGHLVAVSGHPDAAQQIAHEANYAYLPDMDLPVLKSWIEQSGLTPAELERIQPNYCPPDYAPQLFYTAGYVWTAVVLAGVIGLPFSLWSGWELVRFRPKLRGKMKIGAVIGFIMVLLGLVLVGLVASGNADMFHPDTSNPTDLVFEGCHWALGGGSPPEIHPTQASYLHGLAAMVAGLVYVQLYAGAVLRSRRIYKQEQAHDMLLENELPES